MKKESKEWVTIRMMLIAYPHMTVSQAAKHVTIMRDII
jgi:hypothetical protein